MRNKPGFQKNQLDFLLNCEGDVRKMADQEITLIVNSGNSIHIVNASENASSPTGSSFFHVPTSFSCFKIQILDTNYSRTEVIVQNASQHSHPVSPR